MTIYVKLLNGRLLTLYNISKRHDVAKTVLDLARTMGFGHTMTEDIRLCDMEMVLETTKGVGIHYMLLMDNDPQYLYRLSNGQTLYQRLRDGVAGGGKPRGGVIKTIVKCSLSEKTLASDEKLFADCYKLAVSVHASTSTSLKTALNSMSDADLQELQDYILKDKTTNALKVAKLAEWLGEYKLIVKVQQKLSSSLEAMKDMVQADLEKNFSVDGFPQIGMVKDLVGKIIYARGEAREPSMKD
jgi:hypothetical protein